MTTKEQFIEMAKGITRPGIDQMMAWLETTDFYTAPASTRFHGAEEGGLCAHSITVAKRLLEIADLWAPNQYSRDTLLTGCALSRPVQGFHLSGEYAQCEG